MEIIIPSIEGLNKAVAELLAFVGERKVLLFSGEIGAGKTTFIQAFCRHFEVREKVTSPTFSLINEYSFLDNKGKESNIYHMDLYRLKQMEEALDIGIEEYLYSEKYCLIEWPEIIENILPEDSVSINIEEIEEGKRRMRLVMDGEMLDG